MFRSRLLAVLGVSAVVLAACGGDSGSSSSSTTTAKATSITIGSAGFTENEILANVYATALGNAGIKVTLKTKLGPREIVEPALEKGEIDLVPEYLGNLLAFFDPTASKPGDDVAATLVKLQTVAKTKKLTVLEPSKATDGDIIAMTKAKATALGATKISDLKGKDSTLVMGGPPECATRVTCLKGLQDVYGLKFKEFKPLDTGGPLTVTALKDGTVHLARLFSADTAIKDNDFVVLDDDKFIQPAGNVVPLIRDSAVTDKIRTVLDKVSSTMTTDQLVALNAEVSGPTKPDPKTVAEKWVTTYLSLAERLPECACPPDR
jgi:osmoprotectant transport system substrate-binding protein